VVPVHRGQDDRPHRLRVERLGLVFGAVQVVEGERRLGTRRVHAATSSAEHGLHDGIALAHEREFIAALRLPGVERSRSDHDLDGAVRH
jgi:hypothetical protein